MKVERKKSYLKQGYGGKSGPPATTRRLILDDLDFEWGVDGACRPVEVDFFCAQDDPELVAEAKDVCRGCVVRERCGEFAMGNHIEYGIWGGMTTNERRKRVRKAAGGGDAAA